MPSMHPNIYAAAHLRDQVFDAGVSLRDVQIAARRADPKTTMRTSGHGGTSIDTPTTSSQPSWPPASDSRRTRSVVVPMSGADVWRFRVAKCSRVGTKVTPA
jgi:hypothetical protein